MKIGIDIGSTTIKCVVLDTNDNIVYHSYERHYSQIAEKTTELINIVRQNFALQDGLVLAISGSAGMGLAEKCGIPFVQEVFATRVALRNRLPETDAAIELGGEDAKILFLKNGLEVRMNGSCAGGTGAFIDQMATLLDITPQQMNDYAARAQRLYTIASRCGVFAKSDIQPLLNQGANHDDIAASIFSAVVNQTVAGLAQGRPITGNVIYLGGPLTFLSELRKSFDSTLKVTGLCPENSLYYVAIGAALCADRAIEPQKALHLLGNLSHTGQYHFIEPLFENDRQYSDFCARHSRCTIEEADPAAYTGRAFLGVDAGSTTIKLAVIDDEGCLLSSVYQPNKGNPVPVVREFLIDFYTRYPRIAIAGATATGYGEDFIKNAFSLDYGIVETAAHLAAAQHFLPDVEFIIDIGGQDIKCFKIENGIIDSIFLNEACSSGCGSFLQTFANALGYNVEDFARLGLFADRPVDLGSRCTVFMNSSVKQAQKDGASIQNISAGLSISVVKNALYKVIRASSPEELGRHVVVQGGTFLNDAVLRAFEQEMKLEAVRPTIAGLMGAYGAALYAQSHPKSQSSIATLAQLESFIHNIKDINCGLCENHCHLTINTFFGGRKYISGNRCERPVTNRHNFNALNIYNYKLELLKAYGPNPQAKRGVIGIPMGLNMFELLPFWHAFFSQLDFSIVTSPLSDREIYLLGQSTIPSDTVCFPAKLMHGHVQTLIDNGIKTVFYPCMSYNLDENLGDNHYNCPVVAYYPEVIGANMPDLRSATFIKDYVGIHRPYEFPKKMHKILTDYFPDDNITLSEVQNAAKAAYAEQDVYLARIRERGEAIIQEARANGSPIIVLAGRPYHIDPEINHGIDNLITSFGVGVISEDVISDRVPKFPVNVLNQWTYHSRLYAAARYIKDQPDMHLVQLVSFGCGIDAITTDEVRSLLEDEGRLYTQIKIDEITNLGAVKIRLRSLFAAVDQKNVQTAAGGSCHA
ncbi:acyl-CoA dehydratase activase-related protein [Oscillospiraceae bacterium LTW-04]|nr:acyl-CoA dehydratase activase-related protein [Oscillospiraceae bacterium MB24-C1]